MSNIKVGGRVYRDIEKMTLEQLQELRKALVDYQLTIAKKGQALPKHPSSIQRFQALNQQMQITTRQLAQVDALAKLLVKQDVQSKLNANAPIESILTP